MPALQFRAIVLTDWHLVEWTEEDLRILDVQFIAYAREHAPTTGRPHHQTWMYSGEKKKWTWHKWFSKLEPYIGNDHFEKMNGTFEQNDVYCSKEGELIKVGVPPMKNGQHKTVLEVKKRLDSGKRVMEIAEDDEMFPTVARQSKFFYEYQNYKRTKTLEQNRDAPSVYVRIGPAGTGKTRWLDEQFGLAGWVFAPDNTGRWFDGCDRDVICFDDVEAGQVPPLSLWKRLTDRYPMQVPVKGGFITWKPKTIVFTSNTHPKQWWPELSEFDLQAIERRLTDVVVVENEDE
jgi:hypothetical protein